MPAYRSKNQQTSAPQLEKALPDKGTLAALRLINRFGLPPATAAVVVELAFSKIETWRATR